MIPASAHRQVSPTYGGRNRGLIGPDSESLQEAAQRDTEAMREEIEKHADEDCVKAYKDAADKIDELTDDQYESFLLDCLEAT